jgi:hypothetical protein
MIDNTAFSATIEIWIMIEQHARPEFLQRRTHLPRVESKHSEVFVTKTYVEPETEMLQINTGHFMRDTSLSRLERTTAEQIA